MNLSTSNKLRVAVRLGAVALAGVVVLGACGDDGGSGSAGATFEFKPLDVGGPLTVAALENGDIDIALLFSSDGAIAAKGFVALEDDKLLQPVENLVLVGGKDKLDAAVNAVVEPAMKALTTNELSTLNKQLNIDKQDPADAAKAWLETGGFLKSGESLKGNKYTVGSSNFNEQELVSSMVSQLLSANGAEVSEKFKIGAREVVAPALANGDIDLYVEYVGSYLTFLGGTPTTDLAKSLDALRAAAEPKGVTVGAVAPAEDKNAFVVTKATADKYKLTKVSDLATVEESLTLGGPPECPKRPLCMLGLIETYGLKFDV
jgi:glycine betaine/choline ABC-type transport system substrate-binding protein